MQAYPFATPFLYFGPFNCSLVYPLLNHGPHNRAMKIWNFDKDGFGDRRCGKDLCARRPTVSLDAVTQAKDGGP